MGQRSIGSGMAAWRRVLVCAAAATMAILLAHETGAQDTRLRALRGIEGLHIFVSAYSGSGSGDPRALAPCPLDTATLERRGADALRGVGLSAMTFAETMARVRANFGFDQPVIVQYGLWLKRVLLHADFGYSYVTGEPVIEMIWQRLPATLELMGAAFLLAFLFGLSGGIVAALKRYTKFDSVIMLVTLFGISIPVFWLGLMSMMLFTVQWRLLPSAGMFALGVPFSVVDHLRHLLMPSLVLSLWGGAIRFTTPMLFALAFLPMFGIGGLSGLPLGLAASDVMLHDTWYVVGHFHFLVAPGTLFASRWTWPTSPGRGSRSAVKPATHLARTARSCRFR